MALFWHALRLDFSTICFIMVIPYLILGIHFFVQKKWMLTIIKYYHFLLIAVYSLIATAEIGIYNDWLTKLNVKAIKYLSHPDEIYNSCETGKFYFLLIIFIVQTGIGCLIYSRWVHLKENKFEKKIGYFIFYMITGAFLLVLGMRGGLQQIPVNQSSVYFSEHNILNQVAVNPAWNLVHSLHQNYYSMEKNPFIFFDQDEAKKIIENLYHVKKDTTKIILNNPRPNIFFIILEGWSSSVIGSLGGEKDITPSFDSLAKSGFLFTQCHAPGFRSDQGIASIFSAFPATPLSTITRQPDKFVKLPFLTPHFVDLGYHTSFYFGGQLDYGNIKGYIYANNFDKITEEKDFPASIPRGKLGVHDQFLYPLILSDLKNEQQPFYTALFTSSTHTPYDYPHPVQKFKFKRESDYANSMYYADSCLNDFFQKARKEAWFKNTLFIIVGDHGHGAVTEIYDWLPGLQKIPLLFYGDVIKEEYRGKTFDEPVSQLDVATTLLHQTGQESSEFHWSQDLFNPYKKSFAYYAVEVGFALVTNEGYYSYSCDLDKIQYIEVPESKADSLIKIGKCYLQTSYQEYFDY